MEIWRADCEERVAFRVAADTVHAVYDATAVIMDHRT